jgi:tight adherence protein C
MTAPVVGAGLGGLAAVGLITTIAGSPPMRRIRLDDRLAPYLRELSRPSGLLPTVARTPGIPESLWRLVGPVIRDLAGRVDDWVGGASSVRRRLDQAATGMTVEAFRIEQVVYGGAGLGIGLMLALIAAARGSRRSPFAFLVLALVLSVAGVFLRDRLLTRQVIRRDARITTEFPTVAELLALAVGAGESLLGALDRVARSSGGELARDLRAVLADARAGVPLTSALEALAARTSVAAVSRFVEGMTVALDRGTPLADVLRSQAGDVREADRRALLEAGGRKEIQMLVPVVFFILPVTVVFALFPGFYSVQLAVP